MWMNVSVNQEKILNRLLDKYENSKTYEGKNQILQKFSIEPAEIWADYVSDYADVAKVRDFETEIQCLKNAGLITAEKVSGVITKITACNEILEDYYALLGRTPKRNLIQEQLQFFQKWQENKNVVISKFCEEQMNRIRAGKKITYKLDVCESILRLLDYILNNTDELLERELSVLLLGDSKVFEKKYRTKVCKIIRSHMDFEAKLTGIDQPREQEKVILEEFHVFTNPSYIYLKGPIRVRFMDGKNILIGSEPIALSSALIKKIMSIVVDAKKVITVENLTSFHRSNSANGVYIFLSGYHNSEKQAFLKRVAKENPGKEWSHFGDIDPDGFYILEHLRNGTGIDAHAMHMGVEELEQYRRYCKQLTDGDRVKAQNLLDAGCYVETMKYMLQHDCKLEQEILSFAGRINS